MDHKKSHQTGKLDEIADQLDDVKIAVDELEDESTGSKGAIRRLKDAVDRARDVADDLEDEQ